MSLDVLVRAWKHSRQSGSTLLALLALSQASDDDGVLWLRGVTVDFIGKKARVKKRQTQNILRELEAAGEIYAPPAAGRGNTTRYFVTIGLDAKEIAAVLAREYRQTPIESLSMAEVILSRQSEPDEKMQRIASFNDGEDAPKSRERAKKMQPSASIKKVQSSTKKGAIQYHENGRSEASGRAALDPIDHVRSHVGGGGDRARESNDVAQNAVDPLIALFARYDITQAEPLARMYHEKWPDVTIERLTRLCEELNEPDAGSYAGARLYRKLKAGPYERQQPGRPDNAPDRPGRPPVAARGKHGPTGGSDLRDPGWREREIAKFEALARENGEL